MKVVTITKRYEFPDEMSDEECVNSALEILSQSEFDDDDIDIKKVSECSDEADG